MQEYLTIDHLKTKDIIRVFSKIHISTERFYKETPCWEWTSQISSGYGYVSWHNRPIQVHRLMFAWICEPVPTIESGLEIDHLCRNRRCSNPLHLEIVTRQINSHRGISPAAINAQKAECPNGHSYSRRGNGNRQCQTCINENRKRKRQDDPEWAAQDRERKRVSRLRRLSLPGAREAERAKHKAYRQSNPDVYQRELDARKARRRYA